MEKSELEQIVVFVFQSSSEEAQAAIQAALSAGYRHIDTAYSYFNEVDIGKALKSWMEAGGKREELFIVTKVCIFSAYQ